jgi:hypothetical protein
MDCFAGLIYSEVKAPTPKGMPAEFGTYALVTNTPVRLFSRAIISHCQFEPAGSDAQESDSNARWRDLSAEITPTGIRVYFDRNLVREAKVERLGFAYKGLLSKFPEMIGIAPQFQPRQSLGLIVWRGAAAFRNVILEPLD